MNKIEEITTLAVLGMTLALSTQSASNAQVTMDSTCGPKYYVRGCQCNVDGPKKMGFKKKGIRAEAPEQVV